MAKCARRDRKICCNSGVLEIKISICSGLKFNIMSRLIGKP